MKAPDYVMTLTGWRCWLVISRGRGYGLASLGAPYVWPWRKAAQKDPDCDCGYRRGKQRHSCGLYAYKEKGFMMEHGKELARSISDFYPAWERPPELKGFAFGCMDLWGEVVEHENGYRAEFAYPKRIRVVAIPSVEELDLAVGPYIEQAFQLSAEIAEGLAKSYGLEDCKVGWTVERGLRRQYELRLVDDFEMVVEPA